MSSETEKILIAVARGFDDAYKRLDRIEDSMATKDDAKRLEQRLDILEYRVLNSQTARLDILEDNVRQIKTKLGMA